MDLSLTTIVSDCRPARLIELKPNTPVRVWGRWFIYKTPKADPQPIEPPRLLDVSRSRVPRLGDGETPTPEWGKTMKRKTGPKSARPFWESVLGRKIPDLVWASAMKQTQWTRGAKPITKEDLLRRIARMEANA